MASFHGYANGAKDLLRQIRGFSQNYVVATACTGPANGHISIGSDATAVAGTITLTCTVAGGDGVAQFTVAGAAAGTLTSGTPLVNAGYSVDASTDTTFSVGEVFTVTTGAGIIGADAWTEQSFTEAAETTWVTSIPGPCADSAFSLTATTRTTGGCENIGFTVEGSPTVYLYLDKDSEYFMTIDDRGMVGVAITQGFWESFYVGYIDQFSSDLGQPQPLFVGAMGSQNDWKPDETGHGHSSFFHPQSDLFGQVPTSAYLFSGTWQEVRNIRGTTSLQQDRVVYPYGCLRVSNRCDGTSVWDKLLPAPNGEIFSQDAIVWIQPDQINGSLRNFKAVASSGNAPGNIMTIDGNDYLVIQNSASTVQLAGLYMDPNQIDTVK